MNNSLFIIERARPEEAAALLDYLKIVGGETENLSCGAAPALMEAILAFAKENGLVGLKGHRKVGGCRASIYNAVPYEGVARLIEVMELFKKQN